MGAGHRVLSVVGSSGNTFGAVQNARSNRGSMAEEMSTFSTSQLPVV